MSEDESMSDNERGKASKDISACFGRSDAFGLQDRAVVYNYSSAAWKAHQSSLIKHVIHIWLSATKRDSLHEQLSCRTHGNVPTSCP